MKKICTLDVGAFRYRVFSADPKEVPGMDDPCEGYTRHDDCTIFLNKRLHPSRVKEVLVHELLHAMFDAGGIHNLLDLYLPNTEGVDNSGARDIMEELTIRSLTPLVITVLRQIPKVLK